MERSPGAGQDVPVDHEPVVRLCRRFATELDLIPVFDESSSPCSAPIRHRPRRRRCAASRAVAPARRRWCRGGRGGALVVRPARLRQICINFSRPEGSSRISNSANSWCRIGVSAPMPSLSTVPAVNRRWRLVLQRRICMRRHALGAPPRMGVAERAWDVGMPCKVSVTPSS